MLSERNINMAYSAKQIDLFCQALEDDKEALALLGRECKNLAILHTALRGNVEAMSWLFENDKILAAFDAGIGGNKSAIRLLIKLNEFEWAAVANFVKGDQKALDWLQKNKLSHFIRLAYCIKRVL